MEQKVIYLCLLRACPLELASGDKKSWFYKVANPSPVGDIGSAGESTGSGSTSIHNAGSSSSHTHHHHHSSTSSSSLPEVPGHRLREEWESEERLNY